MWCSLASPLEKPNQPSGYALEKKFEQKLNQQIDSLKANQADKTTQDSHSRDLETLTKSVRLLLTQVNQIADKLNIPTPQMCPQQTIPATRPPPRFSLSHPRSSIGPRTPVSHSHQRTINEYFCAVLNPPAPANDSTAPVPWVGLASPTAMQESYTSTPPTTPVAIEHTVLTPASQSATTSP